MVEDRAELPGEVLEEYVRGPIAEIPASIAGRIGACAVRIEARLDGEASSRWTASEAGGAEIELAAGGLEPHDLAMELLICVGQIVWERAAEEERSEYLRLLERELREGASGEIDEDVLRAKKAFGASAD